MATVNGNPQPGEIYADVLWNTALLPAFVLNNAGARVDKAAAASIPVIVISNLDNNPQNPEDFRLLVSDYISKTCYSGTPYIGGNGGYDILKSTYTTTSGPAATTTGQNIPSRYVVMGGKVVAGVPQNQADQYQVTAVGQGDFVQTDWRVPPNYTQSSPAV